MIPDGQGVAVAFQTVLAAVGVGLAIGLLPRYRRPPVPAWAASWTALLVYLVFTNVPSGEATVLGSQPVLRVAVSTVGQGAGFLHVALVLAGAAAFVRWRPLEPATYRGLTLVCVAAGLGLSLVFVGDLGRDSAFLLGKIRVRSLTGGVLFLAGAGWLATRRIDPLREGGRRALAVSLLVLGAASLVTAAFRARMALGGPDLVGRGLVPFMDILAYGAFGMGSVMAILEYERGVARASAATADEAAQARVRSESWFQTLIQNVSEIVAVIDAEAKCLYVSPSVARVTGWSTQDVVGRSVFDFVHPEDQPRLAAELGRLQAGVPDGPPAGFRLQRRDGEWLVVEASGVRLPAEAGQVGFLVIARDVTARRQAEERQRRLEQQLLQAQKLESVGRLAGGIAHDFNNLLTVVYAHLEGARTRLGGHSADEDVREAEAAARRAGELTRQLLAFSRQQVAARQVIELDRLTRDLTGLLGRVVGETVRLEVTLGASGTFVDADPVQLEQVLLNLAVNARDAMDGEGTLTITTRRLAVGDDDGEADGRLTPGPWVVISVSDTGAGIAPEVAPLIFEPFFTTKPASTGTGLGLATCFGIVRQHGGEIWFESTVGAGTTFHVALRAVPAPLVRPESEPAAGAPTGWEAVLVVEDDRTVRRVVSRALATAGYAVTEAPDIATARELVRSGARFALLLTDVVMPDGGGLRLADELSAGLPGLRVLLMSGYTAELRPGERPATAPRGFLPKPFTTNQLLVTVRQLLDESEELPVGAPVAGAG